MEEFWWGARGENYSHDIAAELPKMRWLRNIRWGSGTCGHQARLRARFKSRRPAGASWGFSSPNIPLSSTGFFVDFLFVKGSDKEFFEGKNNLCFIPADFFQVFQGVSFWLYDSASVWLRHLACSPKNSWQNTWVFQWKLEKVFSTDKLRHHASNLAAKEFESDLEYLICHSLG